MQQEEKPNKFSFAERFKAIIELCKKYLGLAAQPDDPLSDFEQVSVSGTDHRLIFLMIHFQGTSL